MISNAITSEHRKKKHVTFIEAMHDIIEEPAYNEQPYHELVDGIQCTISAMHWYDKQLFMLYVNSGKSMRKIAADTGISLTSINNTIQNVKRTIKEDHEKDYRKTKKACK
jgi:DNA-directed RNA polymerase specialized sigma24 family protein